MQILKTKIKSIYNDIQDVIRIENKIKFLVIDGSTYRMELSKGDSGSFYMASIFRWRKKPSHIYSPKLMWSLKTFVENGRLDEYSFKIRPRALIEISNFSICVDNKPKGKNYNYFYCDINNINFLGVVDASGKDLEYEIDNTELKEKLDAIETK